MGLCQTKHIHEMVEQEHEGGPITYSKYDNNNTTTKKSKPKFGQYPGNKRPVHTPYVPNDSEFNGGAGVTKHFVNYGGGNALTLVDGPPPNSPPSGEEGKQYIQVTLPPGSYPGELLHVKSPDGQLVAIRVPEGMSEGELFTVQFSQSPDPSSQIPNKEEQYSPNYSQSQSQYQPPQPVTAVASSSHYNKTNDDDGIPVAVPL